MLSFFESLNAMSASVAIRESVWISPVVNVLHLLCLVLLAGAVLIVDLRLMGAGAKEQPLAKVAQDAQPWLIVALVGLLATGIPQLISNALREYYSIFFWTKTYVLLIALVYTFTLRRGVTLADEGRIAPFRKKVVGLVSILLWAGVAIPARLIGLFT
jgi:hypothetical protein